jgi:dihydrofolate reductase
VRLVVINHVTLDGVLQGPSRPDEDTRGGFSHSGWAKSLGDEVIGRVLGARMGRPDGGLLLGRWSYESMLASWNAQGGPFKDALNDAPKYVASRDPATRLEWPNSTLLSGDIPAAVAELKQNKGGDLVVMGSGQLIPLAAAARTDRRVSTADLPAHPRVGPAPVRSREPHGPAAPR